MSRSAYWSAAKGCAGAREARRRGTRVADKYRVAREDREAEGGSARRLLQHAETAREAARTAISTMGANVGWTPSASRSAWGCCAGGTGPSNPSDLSSHGGDVDRMIHGSDASLARCGPLDDEVRERLEPIDATKRYGATKTAGEGSRAVSCDVSDRPRVPSAKSFRRPAAWLQNNWGIHFLIYKP